MAGAGGHGRLGDGGSSDADPVFLKVREGASGPGSAHSWPMCHLGLVDQRWKALDCTVVYISVYAGITVPGLYLQGVRCNRWVGHRKVFF